MKTQFKIWKEANGYSIKGADVFEYTNFSKELDLEDVASEYAQYYYDEADGWEEEWPITFNVADMDGKYLGKVEVLCEFDPSFHGTLLTGEEDGRHEETDERNNR